MLLILCCCFESSRDPPFHIWSSLQFPDVPCSSSSEYLKRQKWRGETLNLGAHFLQKKQKTKTKLLSAFIAEGNDLPLFFFMSQFCSHWRVCSWHEAAAHSVFLFVFFNLIVCLCVDVALSNVMFLLLSVRKASLENPIMSAIGFLRSPLEPTGWATKPALN